MTKQLTLAERKQMTTVAQQSIEAAVNKSIPVIDAFGIKPQVLTRVAFNALARSPELIQCDATSLRNAILICCQRGLMPDGESCALIPFKGSVEVVPMVGGLLDLARHAIPGIEVASGVVWQGDEYDYSTGIDLVLNVRPKAGVRRNIETLVAAWAVVKFPDGQVEHEWMWREEILHVMNSTRGGQKGLWSKHFMRACRKTPLRALLRRLPVRGTDILRNHSQSAVGAFADGSTPDYDADADLTLPGHYADEQPAIEAPAPAREDPPPPSDADAPPPQEPAKPARKAPARRTTARAKKPAQAKTPPAPKPPAQPAPQPAPQKRSANNAPYEITGQTGLQETEMPLVEDPPEASPDMETDEYYSEENPKW